MMVNRVMAPLYEGEFTPESVVALGADGFLAKIRSIGLAPTKSKNVVKFSSILLEKFGGEVPNSREDLESLPGVGRKTANVILGEIFRHPTLAVDTHVYRVSRRLGLQNEKTPEKAELELLKVVDPKFLPDGHHHFILHGRYVCKALTPLCDVCVLSDICPSYEDLRSKPEEKAEAKAAAKARAKMAKASDKAKTKTKAKTPGKAKAKKLAKPAVRISDIKLPRAKKKS